MFLNTCKHSKTLHQAKVGQLIRSCISCSFLSLEIENAGLRNQLLKRDTEFNELKSTLNETLHKVRSRRDLLS
jgi:hypothetical protein